MARQIMAADEVVAFLGRLAPSSRGSDAAGKHVVVLPPAVRRAVVWANLARNRLRGYRLAMQGQGIGAMAPVKYPALIPNISTRGSGAVGGDGASPRLEKSARVLCRSIQRHAHTKASKP